MKCPNCSSSMFVSNENTTDRSKVKFYRCTLCIGEHVVSEPVANDQLLAGTEEDYFNSSVGFNGRIAQLV
jgi:hypothetical protein